MTARFALRCLLSVALLALPALPAEAQNSAYPNVDKPVAIAPSETVQLLNRFVVDGSLATRPPGRRLDFVYATQIPASDAEARQAQADRAAQFFGPEAIELGARRLSIGVCDTRACAENKDPPAAWYLYERTSNGWRRSR